MIDTYLKSKNLAALEELGGFVTNMIRPVKGSDEIPAYEDNDGNIIDAVPAKGNSGYWYACVRAPFPVAPFPVAPYGEIEACSHQEGETVCGVWA